MAGAQSSAGELNSALRTGGPQGSVATARLEVQISLVPLRRDMKQSSRRSAVKEGASSATELESEATRCGAPNRGGEGTVCLVPSNSPCSPQAAANSATGTMNAIRPARTAARSIFRPTLTLNDVFSS